jgi:hypothetical protein
VIGEPERAFHQHSSAARDQQCARQFPSGERRDVRVDAPYEGGIIDPPGGLGEPRGRRGRERDGADDETAAGGGHARTPVEKVASSGRC